MPYQKICVISHLLVMLNHQPQNTMKSLFNKACKSFILTAIVCGTWAVSAQNPIRVYNSVTIDRSDCTSLSKIILHLPYCESNDYQYVENHRFGPQGQVRTTDEDQRYIWLKNTNFTNLPSQITYTDTFDFISTHFVRNLDSITTLYPYDPTSEEILWFTGTEDVYVTPQNPVIDSLADLIWNQSSNVLDFARRSYEYVASHLTYQNPNTGLHSIADIIADGGGDCGNFASFYISILRNKGIPARHVIGFSPYNGNDMHIWAEFYLQGYGWIPADPTYKNSDPNGDYFGRYDYNYCIAGKGINHSYYIDGQYQNISLLQLFSYWYWYTSSCNNINFYREVAYDNLYHITGVPEDPTFGNVIGSGYYVPGETGTLEAISAHGYIFSHWSNGSTENPLTFTLTGDSNLTAYFTPVVYDTIYIHDTIIQPLTYYTLTSQSANINQGLVAGNGRYPEGTGIEIAAVPLQGYRFIQWNDGSTENPRTVTLNEDLTFMASFEANPTGINDAETADYTIGTRDGSIVITNAPGQQIRIFDNLGRCLITDQGASTTRIFPVPTTGTYMIQVGTIPARKVVVVK